MKLGPWFSTAAAVAVAVGGVGTTAQGGIATFTGTDSSGRAASAAFENVGGSLKVTLTNTATYDTLVPIDVLTGVFWDIAGAPLALTRTSAVLNAGSTVFIGNTNTPGPVDPGNVVGGEWAYLGGLSGAPGGADYGISSAGLGLFGPGDRFPGTDLFPPTDPDGIAYGIVTATDTQTTGNGGLGGGRPLIKNSVVFTLGNVGLDFDPMASIGNVWFQYGTALDEPHFPAPGSASVLVLGGIAAARRRRR